MPVNNAPRIASQVLTDVVERMANQTIGFNAQLAQTIADNARYTQNASFLLTKPLVFPMNTDTGEVTYAGFSPNVTLAPISIDDWMETSAIIQQQCLLMNIYVINAINLQTTKGLTFDGKINIGVDCHIAWLNGKALFDFDAPLSAVEDSIFSIFCKVDPPYQYWSQGVIFNGVVSVPARSGLVAKPPGFRALTTLTLQFGLQKQ